MATLTSALIGAALLIAVVSVERTRRMSKRLDRMREAYWDLRYELGQVQARVTRLEADRPDQPPPSQAAGAGAQTFVPLSSLKR